MCQVPTTERPGYLLKRAQAALGQACTERLRPTGLSMSQYAVLRQLADHPGVSSAELARLVFVTRQSLRDVLGGLRTAGLVDVAEQATSGRALPVTLTAAGKTRLRTADELIIEVETRMMAGIPATDQRRLSTLLAACAENLA